MAGQQASFSILLDRGRIVSKAWQVSVLPTTFMLDGNLAARFCGRRRCRLGAAGNRENRDETEPSKGGR
jgi:hypothetical protein